MYTLDIPGRTSIRLTHAVFDFNGTLAFEGVLLPGIDEWMKNLHTLLTPIVLTADTNDSAQFYTDRLGCQIQVVQSGRQKAEIVRHLNGTVVAVGNGNNDADMFQAAALSIAVIGPEGASLSAVQCADVLVTQIADAFGLLIYPKRLIATLRS